MAGLSGFCRGPAAVFFQKQAGVSQAEAVDRLLYIAYQKELFPTVGNSLENGLLYPAGILVFVHADFGKAVGKTFRQGTGAPVLLQQLQGKMLQVAEIQKAPPPFLPAVGPGKALYQTKQGGDLAADCCQVLQQCFRRLEEGEQPFHIFLAAAADGLGLGLRSRGLAAAQRL